MEENKNKSKGLIIVIIVLIVLLISIMGYIIFGQLKKDKSNDNKTNELSTSSTTILNAEYTSLENKTDDGLLSLGFKEYNINTNEKLNKLLDRGLGNLEDNIDDLKKYYLNDNIKTFEINNNIFNYEYNDGNDKYSYSINNVKSIKYNFVDCSGELIVFIITNDNDVYTIDLSHQYDENIGTRKFKKFNNKYVDVESLYLSVSLCGAVYSYLLIDSNGNYYYLDESKYDVNAFYDNSSLYTTDENSYKMKILTNGTIYFKEKEQTFKYKNGLYFAETDFLSKIISDDGYLYSIEQTGEGYELIKLNESKLNKILYKDYSVIAVFENNKKIEFKDIDTYRMK